MKKDFILNRFDNITYNPAEENFLKDCNYI